MSPAKRHENYRRFGGYKSLAEADAEFRARLVADLEAALAAEGYERDPAVIEALKVRFKSK